MHWHAHGVSALTYTRDGTYLLSGGEEGVLVIWQLQTRHPQFLPRLGAGITSISTSPCEKLYAVQTEDNSVKVIGAADLATKWSIDGLSAAHLDTRMYPLSMGAQPLKDVIALNGLPGTLQFYDPKAGNVAGTVYFV
jgi:NET1-associated nuclear protein 1 (U3 small nucleolar RNA-associated protein 17)